MSVVWRACRGSHVYVFPEVGRICAHGATSPPQVCATKMIELHVHSPDVPSIDLLDLPGLKAAAGPQDAPDMPQQVEALVRSQIEQRKESAVFLATIDASMKSEASLGMKLIVEYGLQDRTIGVLTKCDDLGRASMRTLPARLQQTDAGIKLQPHGYVATMTAPLDDPPEGSSHIEQLEQMAREELKFFDEQSLLQPMVGLGLATCNSVRSHADCSPLMGWV